jgi:trans-2-enoyl-CoA reductase|uniref:enoyl-[acyl-carrier-protein] reductase n=1 Tax=Eutreptiella gymnastica TaxID=73025 RepID=A0A7S4FI10_9EUGL
MAQQDNVEYYKRLGVEKDATHKELRNAFAKKVMTVHPDKGGDEAEFAALHNAYEVLIDERKRRIYDRYGPDALGRTAEGLFSDTFRAGEFSGVDDDKTTKTTRELEALRKENDTLQRQMLILKPETENKYASSFESWLRNRDPIQNKVITSADIMKDIGVCESSYDKVNLPPLRSFIAEYTSTGQELPETVRQRQYDLPTELKWGQVLVHVLAAPITRLDHQLSRFYALHDTKMPAFPAPAGAEGVGVVLKVGPGVETLKERDLVLPGSPVLGTWRRLAVLKAEDLIPFPPTELSPTMVSTFYSFLTAYRLLEDFGSLRPGDTILQSGADSTVGMAVIQICKILKIKTINLVEDSDDFDDVSDTLHAMGANYVWKNTGSIVDRLKKARSGGLPRLGLDCIGSTTLSRICEAMFPEGTVVVYATTTNRVDRFPYIPLMFNGLSIRGFWLWQWLKDNAESVPEVVDKVLPLMEENKFDLEVQHWKQVDESFSAAIKERNSVLEFASVDEAMRVLSATESPENQD